MPTLPINWLLKNHISGAKLGFIAEYQTVWDSFTTKPSADVANADNTFVKTLVDAGLWSTKLDILDHFAQEVNTDGEALKNWILPGTNDPTLVNAAAFVSLEGFTGANTKYINTNWNPNDDGVNYVQNSASGGIYIRTNVAEEKFDFGADPADADDCFIASRWSDNNFYSRINKNAYTVVANTDSRGVFITTRVDGTNQDAYKNKVKSTSAQASSGIPDIDFYVLARNNNGAAGDFCTKQGSLFFAGAGLTQANVNTITDAFETRMDTLGKGVIP